MILLGKGFSLLKVRDSPLPKNPAVDLEKEHPYLLPVCASSRSQGSVADDAQDPAPSTDLSKQIMSKENLIEAQKADPTLAKYHHQAVNKDNIIKSPSFYYQDNLLDFLDPLTSQYMTHGERNIEL